MEIVLASGSPRRRELMTKAGYPFIVRPTDADETVTGTPEERVTALAERKAKAAEYDGRPILAADTLVALNGKCLGKPENRENAKEMLMALSGHTHQVLTGVCVRRETCKTDYACTNVTFRKLTEAEIDAYIATGEPMDKAGAYAIQGGAVDFVEKIEGEWDNVVGLPMKLVKELLNA